MSRRKKKASKVPQRLDWADVAKGIGILLMAVGHSAIPPDRWGIWIYSFHMPLFFFLSGYFFSLRPGGVADTIRHKAFPILMPYLSYSLGMWLWNTLRALSSGAAVDLPPLLGIPLQWPGTPWSGTAWFFMGLFVAECVFALAVRLTRERPLPLLAVTFGLAFCLLLCRKLPPIRPLLTIGRESAAYYAVGWLGSNVVHYAVRAVWPV